MLDNPKLITFIIPIIRGDLVGDCLANIYKYTEKGTFYVYIIDQTINGIDSTALRNMYKNLMVIRTPKSDIHWTGNLGFASAVNLGIKLVETPYFCMLNDDVLLINKKWWQGVVDGFDQIERETPESPAVIVNLASIRLADWSLGRAEGDDFDILPYKKEYSEEDWNFLINEEHYINPELTIKPKTVFDGVTLYASVCHTQRFLEVGLLDERYHPGKGEDYDYSCLARMRGYRSVCTTRSWVWHWWSATFKDVRDKEEIKKLVIPELEWNHNHGKWGENFGIWGVHCPVCRLEMRCTTPEEATCPNHPEQKYKMPESTITPL